MFISALFIWTRNLFVHIIPAFRYFSSVKPIFESVDCYKTPFSSYTIWTRRFANESNGNRIRETWHFQAFSAFFIQDLIQRSTSWTFGTDISNCSQYSTAVMELEHRGKITRGGCQTIWFKVRLCRSLLQLYFDEPNIVPRPRLIDDQRALL